MHTKMIAAEMVFVRLFERGAKQKFEGRSPRGYVPDFSTVLGPVSITAASCVAWRCVASDSQR